jgi:hypothetical protein
MALTINSIYNQLSGVISGTSRIRVEPKFTHKLCQADTLVKTGSGVLHTITFSCNDAAPTAGSIIVYDKTTEAAPIIYSETFTTTAFRGFSVTLDIEFSTGLYVGFTTTADINCVVSYR